MTHPHSIQVVLLHQRYILHHQFSSNMLAFIGIDLMNICTLNKNMLAIYQELSIPDFYFSETYFT